MYNFLSQSNKEAFFAGLENAMNGSAEIHIHGTLTRADGTGIALNGAGNENILGTPSILTQIVSDPDVFCIAEMYIGVLEIELKLSWTETQLEGAEIILSVSVDGCIEDVPMGVWDVKEAQRTPSGTVRITAHDHIARLSAPLKDSSDTGTIRFSVVKKLIEDEAQIEFAQTISQLDELFGYDANHQRVRQINNNYPLSHHFAPNCWLEVQYIAQYLGAYVFANRQGKIEFRRFSPVSVLTIPANRRLNAQISGGAYSVKGFAYIDKYDQETQALSPLQTTESTSVIYLSPENEFIIDRQKDETYNNYYERILEPITEDFAGWSWHTGTVDYYGNPALDVGDVVTLTGGVCGSASRNFLICSNYWQFRSPQTLISGGAPKSSGATSAGGSGGNIYSQTTINATKTIVLAELKGYDGILFGNVARTAARSRFSASEQTAVFITCNMTATSALRAEITVNGQPVSINPEAAAGNTLSFTLPMMLSAGDHDVRIKVTGNGEITSVQGAVWAQSIKALPLVWDESDWEYTVSNETGTAEITGYIGHDTCPEIPEKLGGAPVTAIGDTAFTDNVTVTHIYIPDGIEVIE